MTRTLAAWAGAIVVLAWAASTAWRHFRSPEAWANALSDPATKRALDEGLADVAAGRVQPWDSRTVTLRDMITTAGLDWFDQRGAR